MGAFQILSRVLPFDNSLFDLTVFLLSYITCEYIMSLRLPRSNASKAALDIRRQKSRPRGNIANMYSLLSRAYVVLRDATYQGRYAWGFRCVYLIKSPSCSFADYKMQWGNVSTHRELYYSSAYADRSEMEPCAQDQVLPSRRDVTVAVEDR
jgi:hypothetical protein